VELEFHWLPQMIKRWEREGRDGMVATGAVFEVSCSTVHADKMKFAFEIQWWVCCIAALAGLGAWLT